jgi:hypothetical protein
MEEKVIKMGKILDIVGAIIAVLFAIYIFTRMGITLGDLVHDIKLFIYGSKSSFILGGFL